MMLGLSDISKLFTDMRHINMLFINFKTMEHTEYQKQHKWQVKALETILQCFGKLTVLTTSFVSLHIFLYIHIHTHKDVILA